jgi:hypothetical protein
VRALARLAFGTASPAERRRAVRHLLGGCQSCGRLLARRLLAGGSPRPLAAAMARAVVKAPALERQAAAERSAAAAILDRLASQPLARQRLFLANAAAAHRRAVCELLLERAREQRHRSARKTLRFAELALLVAERRAGPGADELRARAWAEVGNARRIRADLPGAARAFAEAERLIAGGCADPLFRAELLSLRASLAHDHREFTEATELLQGCAMIYDSCGCKPGSAKALVQLGFLHGLRGDPAAGIRPLLRALDLAGDVGDRCLTQIAIQNLIHLVAEAGHPHHASALVAYARPLFERTSEALDRLRFDWVAARIDRDVGLLRTAAAQLERLRTTYAKEELPYEAALVSLDLAAVYARDQRREALRELAAASCDLFRRLGVGREHLASLALLAQVDALEALELIAALAKAVEGSRYSRPSTAASP